VLLNTISFDKYGIIIIDTSRVDLIYNQPFSGHYYVISTDDQSICSRSLWDYNLKTVSVNTGQQSRTLQTGPDQQSLLLLSEGYKKKGKELTITIAEDLNPINKNITQFKYWFTAMALAMLLTLVILQVLILRISLKPINRLHTELKLLQQGQLNKLSTDAPSELRPLIDEVNHLLSITQQRLQRSRHALSDLAHAIKKPLTVIKQIADSHTIPDATQITFLKQTDNIYQISDHILKRARLAGHSHSGALFSFSQDLPALIKTLDMMYSHKTIQLTYHVPDNINCPIDREDMLELLGNLLDNGYKWAIHKVRLSISIDSDLHIRIEDDGPGTELDKINELSKRGVRLDEKTQGHGFGLAITADIVNDYNGNIRFKHSNELGGFQADITLRLKRP
jgi:signal transduction histidine kinase